MIARIVHRLAIEPLDDEPGITRTPRNGIGARVRKKIRARIQPRRHRRNETPKKRRRSSAKPRRPRGRTARPHPDPVPPPRCGPRRGGAAWPSTTPPIGCRSAFPAERGAGAPPVHPAAGSGGTPSSRSRTALRSGHTPVGAFARAREPGPRTGPSRSDRRSGASWRSPLATRRSRRRGSSRTPSGSSGSCPAGPAP